jgi:hypothetical protein
MAEERVSVGFAAVSGRQVRAELEGLVGEVSGENRILYSRASRTTGQL